MGQEENYFERQNNSTSESSICEPKNRCTRDGGYCVRRQRECNGTLDPSGCRGMQCKCCLPGLSTTPRTTTVIPDYTTTTPTECGGMLSSSSGTLRYPFNEGNYQNNENCVLIIRAEEPIIITFVSFETEACCDHLYLLDGESVNSTLLGVFQGSGVPRPSTIPITSNTAYLHFMSDYSVTSAGFEIQWEPSGCGGVYSSDSGTISHFNYTNNENCIWIIRPYTPIILTFLSFETDNCCDHLYLRDEDSTELVVFHGSSIPSPIPVNLNVAYLQFISDQSVTSTGFEIQWEPSECGGVYTSSSGSISHYDYQNDENCVWIINSDTPIIITFVSFETEECCDHLYVRNGVHVDSSEVGVFHGYNVISPIPIPTKSAYLHFTSDDSTTYSGFEITWEPSDCGGVYSSSSGTINHFDYGNDENCAWIIRPDQPITITFVSFETEDGYDYLYVKNGDSHDSAEVGVFHGSSLPSPIPIPTNSALLHFTSDGSVSRNGFMIQWEPSNCGGVYTSNSGTIDHWNYGDNENCVWIIRTEEPITITYDHLETEEDYDYLYLQEGDSIDSSQVAAYSGYLNPDPSTVSTGTAQLHFISDGSVTTTGFNISWSPIECGGVYTSSNGTIEKWSYENNESCVWIIRAGEPITINFDHIETEYSYDFLYLQDGDSLYSNELAAYSGNWSPSPITVHTGTVQLRFVSDGSVTSTGFQISWNPAECGGVFTSSSGTIDHWYYGDNENCVWIIRVEHPITIYYNYLDTESCCDYLYLLEGDSIDSNQLNSYSGYWYPDPITVSTGIAQLNFISDYSATYSGFQISWYPADCGGLYTSSSGTIEHYWYGNNEDCVWLIRVEQPIIIHFDYLDTESYCDYLYLYEGDSIYSNQLAAYYGYWYPDPITVSTGTAQIRFTTDGSVTYSGFQISWHPVDCGGVYTNSSGTIEHWNYGDNENCVWIISTRQPITIHYDHLETESCCDYLYLQDGDSVYSNELASYSGYWWPSPITLTTNTAQLRFVSDGSVTLTGFQISWYPADCGGVYTSNSGTIEHWNYGDNENCVWIIRAGEPITIYYDHLDTEYGYDYLYLQDGDSLYSNELAAYSGNWSPSPVTVHTGTVQLRFVSDGMVTSTGFQISWYPADCGDVYTSSSGTINHFYYGNNDYCTWIIRAGQPITIYYDYFDTESSFDYLYLQDGDSIDSNELASYSGYWWPDPITVSTGTAQLRFDSDGSVIRTGFQISWYPSDPSDCGGVYTSSYGTIDHWYYGDNEYCVWIIRAEEPITIYYNYLETESCCDYLYLEESGSIYSNHLASYSGYWYPDPITVGTNSAQLTFISDGSVTSTGFQISWYPVDCGGVYTSNSGTISRWYYGNYENCVWIIRAGEPITFYIDYLGTESCCDHLYINEGDSIYHNNLNYFSGYWYPDPITVSTDTAHLRFYSDGSVTETGFQVSWYPIACGGVYTSHSGTISRWWYGNNENCVWIIKAGIPITIYYDYLETESCCDYLYLQDGNSFYSTELAGYSGYWYPSPIEVTSNIVQLRFRSDGSVTYAGFQVSWYPTGSTRSFNSTSLREIGKEKTRNTKPNQEVDSIEKNIEDLQVTIEKEIQEDPSNQKRSYNKSITMNDLYLEEKSKVNERDTAKYTMVDIPPEGDSNKSKRENKPYQLNEVIQEKKSMENKSNDTPYANTDALPKEKQRESKSYDNPFTKNDASLVDTLNQN